MSQECITYKTKRAAALLYTPPVRYKPYNPYLSSANLTPEEIAKQPFSLTPTAYTQAELDMRRKAEVLQYRKNGANSGAFTKSKQWSNIARSNGKTFVPVNIKTECGASMSNAAGVPGTPISLVFNPNIPLYNFNVSPTYATELKEDPTIKWTYTASTNIESLIPHILTFSIKPAINTLVTTFTITTPILLKVSGICNRTSGADVSGTFSINLNAPEVRILTYYGGQEVNYRKEPYAVFSSTFRSIVSAKTFSTANGYQFSGTFYMGNLQISNLFLPTSPGYTYDICLNYQPTIIKDTNIETVTATFITSTMSATATTTNMTFITPPSPDPVNPIELVGS
jgi:hypothetical protein